MVKITYYGHATFLIEDKKRILIDPFFTGNPLSPISVSDVKNIDVILPTHGHGDHLGDTIKIAKDTSAKVFAIHEIEQFLSKQGIDAQGMNIGGSIDFDGIKITMVNALHSSSMNQPPFYLGHSAGFIIKLPSVTIYHAGDTGLFLDMKLIAELYKPDIVMLPIGYVYTMGPIEAAKSIEFLKPKIAIPMHYGTFPVLTGTPEKFKELAKNTNVIIFKPGETKEL